MQQEHYLNNKLIPFQIINSKPACNSYNGNLPMFEYGLTPQKQMSLTNSYKSVGILSVNEKESPYYTPIRPDLEYANFLMRSQEKNKKWNEIKNKNEMKNKK